jgi:hypothetical protein
VPAGRLSSQCDEGKIAIHIYNAIIRSKFCESCVPQVPLRLCQPQGKREEAYDLLVPVYSWFTKGFDTVNLQEVKVSLVAPYDSFAILRPVRKR